MLLLGNKFPNNWRRSNHIPVVACHFFPRSLSIQWVQCLVLNHHYQLLVDTHILRPISYNIVNFNSSLLITNPGDLLINITPSTSFPHNKKNTKQKHPQLHLPQKKQHIFSQLPPPTSIFDKKNPARRSDPESRNGFCGSFKSKAKTKREGLQPEVGTSLAGRTVIRG